MSVTTHDIRPSQISQTPAAIVDQNSFVSPAPGKKKITGGRGGWKKEEERDNAEPTIILIPEGDVRDPDYSSSMGGGGAG